MRASLIALLGLSLCIAEARAQDATQMSYPGAKRDVASVCLGRQVEVLAAKKTPASDFLLLATGACQKPISAYRDHVILVETRGGATETEARQRAANAMTQLFREASAAFTSRVQGARDGKGLRLVDLFS